MPTFCNRVTIFTEDWGSNPRSGDNARILAPLGETLNRTFTFLSNMIILSLLSTGFIYFFVRVFI